MIFKGRHQKYIKFYSDNINNHKSIFHKIKITFLSKFNLNIIHINEMVSPL